MKYPRRPPHPHQECVISNKCKVRPSQQACFPEPEQLCFSPSLLMLLSYVYKDGFVNQATIGMIRDILPYLGKQDAQAARYLLQAGDAARDLAAHPCLKSPQPQPQRCWLTQNERLLGLLDTLKKYGGQNSARAFEQLKKYILLREKLLRMKNCGLDASTLPDIAALLDEHSTGSAAQLQKAMAMANALSGMHAGSNLMQAMQMLQTFQT